jgi:hypothetical protein
LNLNAIKDKDGNIDETKSAVEKEQTLYVFDDKGERLPVNALKSLEDLKKVFDNSLSK